MTTTGFVAAATLPTARKNIPIGSTCSAFTPYKPLMPAPPRATPSVRQQPNMKKARYHQPLQPNRQTSDSLPEDGTPVFALFVRGPRSQMWYPLGAVKGDDRSKGLVNAMKGRFLPGMYVAALDKGIAQTVYGKDNNRFLQSALRMYPQLKKYSKSLQFGYRISAVGLEEQKTRLVTRDLIMPFMEWAKKSFNQAINNTPKK